MPLYFGHNTDSPSTDILSGYKLMLHAFSSYENALQALRKFVESVLDR